MSRTARKDGSSDYYVDGKKKTFKEVGVLLRKSGIDLDHNRFLILQVCSINFHLKNIIDVFTLHITRHHTIFRQIVELWTFLFDKNVCD